MEKDITRNCDYYMDSYLMLDKGQIVPLKTAIHIMGCRKCRTEIRQMIRAEKLAAVPLKKHEPTPFLKKPVTIFQWILVGVILIATLSFFGIYTHPIQDPVTYILFSSTFAFTVTAYIALFIGTNLDFFVKKIETKHRYSHE